MTSSDKPKTIVLKAKQGHYNVTGNDVQFMLTPAEVATLSSSANTHFEAVALEMSKQIEKVAKMVSDAE